ncbi:MAG: DUF5011 domain-containing protein, partial [Ruminococcaceae bacterium]|nr:DUF5011 domain-containing protein [Oscillospiraceae bacterium]
GDNPVNMHAGEMYMDAGATALDDRDGDITNKIIKTGTVSPNVPGIYTITYTVTDMAMNETSVTRTVNVIDIESPMITFDPNGNSIYAKNRSTTVTVKDIGGIDNDTLKYVWTTSTEEPSIDSFTNSFVSGGTIQTPLGVSGSYYLWATATDISHNKVTTRSNVFNLDNEKPVITINGNSNITINKGTVYSDAGATATDNIDSTVTVTSSGTVNPNIVGTYTITYNATDSSGNTATPVTRTINVIDVSAPVITILGSNPVTINVGSTYTDAGATAMDDVDGNVTSRIVVTGTVSPNIVGTYTITYTVTDTAGNKSTATRTVNVIDNVLPTVTFGTNGNSTYAKSRSTKVTVSDNVSVNTNSLKYLWNTSTTPPSEASITTTFTNGGTINTPAGVTGDYYLWILAKDTTGNTTIGRTNVFKLDNTIPVITVNPTSITITEGTTYTDAGVTASDAHSGLNGSVTSSGTVNPNVPGTYTITYNVSDKAGNVAVAKTRTVTVLKSDYNLAKGVNYPKLATGMTPIK